MVTYNLVSACTTYTANSCNVMTGYSGYYVNCYILYTYADDGGGDRRLEELEIESSELQSYESAFADKFQVERHSTGSRLQQLCSPCGRGQYCPGTGIAYACPAGTYGSITGLSQPTQCTACPAGKLAHHL